MRVAIFNGAGRPITIERVPDPEPGPQELVLKICRCGICGSDISMTSGGPMTYATGRFGHEYAGEVVEVGCEVKNVRVGDRIASPPAAACGNCEGCREGNPLLCNSVRALCDGFGEYATIPAKSAVLLPQSLSFADGALVEPMACGLHGLRLAQMRGKERVLVLGGGSMALAVIYWARRLGAAKIVVVARSAHRRDIALAMGADAVLGGDAEDPRILIDALGGRPDIVAECIGKEGILNKAIDQVRPQGTVICMGMCMHGETLVAAHCACKELRLLFPHGYTIAEFVETARAFDSSFVRPELMVSDVIALQNLPSTIEALRAGKKKSLKIQVDPSLESVGA